MPPALATALSTQTPIRRPHSPGSQAFVIPSTTFYMADDVCGPQNAADLPIELKLLILEQLSDDEISSLVLVWKDILPEVRARRFSKLTVQPRARYSWRAETPDSDCGSESVAKVGSSMRTMQPSRQSGKHVPMSEAERQCESLRRLTDALNEAPEVAEYIKSLEIRDWHPDRSDTSQLKFALSHSPSLPAFVATIPQMSNLSHLCLHNLDFYLFHDPRVIHRALRQCHITSLEVKSCTLNISIFLTILYAVVNLDVLRLENLHLNPGFGHKGLSTHIIDFDNIETWKYSKSAFLCVDELHVKLHTHDDWLFFDLLLSKNYSPLYDIRAVYMLYESLYDSPIGPGLYFERISRFIECYDLEGLHLGIWWHNDPLPPLQHIGGIQTLELGLAVTNRWEPHSAPMSWCTQTLANIAQTSCLAYLTLTFEITAHAHYVQMPSFDLTPQGWKELDRLLMELELEELTLAFPLSFVNRYEVFIDRAVFSEDEKRDLEMQMKSRIQTWFLESCLPGSGKRYFCCDDPAENVGTFSFDWRSTMVDHSSIRVERPNSVTNQYSYEEPRYTLGFPPL